MSSVTDVGTSAEKAIASWSKSGIDSGVMVRSTLINRYCVESLERMSLRKAFKGACLILCRGSASELDGKTLRSAR